MKKILSAVSLAAFMVACNPTPSTTPAPATTQATRTDTVGLAQYQAWKAQNELAPNTSPYGVTGQSVANPPVTRYTTTTTHRSTSRSSSGGGSMNSSSNNTAMAPAPQKKGWSKAAKGAVIGGVGGAVIGGVLDKKNRGAGAVIGGILGAGAGYGIGRGQDKRSGRY